MYVRGIFCELQFEPLYNYFLCLVTCQGNHLTVNRSKGKIKRVAALNNKYKVIYCLVENHLPGKFFVNDP